MSDRLAELRRQRALLEEHLAWLDREIAAEAKRVPAERVVAPHPVTPGIPAASPARTLSVATQTDATVATTVNVVAPGVASTASAAPAALPGTALSTAEADAMLDKYRMEPDRLRSDVKKGCLLYFALAFVLFGLGVAVLWFALK